MKKTFHLILDCDAGTLGFAQNGVWLGIAHSNLKVLLAKVNMKENWVQKRTPSKVYENKGVKILCLDIDPRWSLLKPI